MKEQLEEYKALLEVVNPFTGEDLKEAYGILVMGTMLELLEFAVEKGCMSNALSSCIQDFLMKCICSGIGSISAVDSLIWNRLGLTEEVCDKFEQDEIRAWMQDVSEAIKTLPYFDPLNYDLLRFGNDEWKEQKQVYGFCRMLTAVSKETGLEHCKIIEGLGNRLSGMIDDGWMSAIALSRAIEDWCSILNSPCRDLYELEYREVEQLVDEEAANSMFEKIYNKRGETGWPYEVIIRMLWT